MCKQVKYCVFRLVDELRDKQTVVDLYSNNLGEGTERNEKVRNQHGKKQNIPSPSNSLNIEPVER